MGEMRSLASGENGCPCIPSALQRGAPVSSACRRRLPLPSHPKTPPVGDWGGAEGELPCRA